MRHRIVRAAVISLVMSSAATAGAASEALRETARLLRFALSKPSRKGALVLNGVRAANDPALAPLFEKAARSKHQALALIGMIDANLVTRSPATVSVSRILHCPKRALIGPALSILVDKGTVTVQQLDQIATRAPRAAQRMMGIAKLVEIKHLKNTAMLTSLANNRHRGVRYFVAVVELETGDKALVAKALGTLRQLAKRSDGRSTQLQKLLLMDISNRQLAVASPFAVALARSNTISKGVRRMATATLLLLGQPAGAPAFAALARTEKHTINRIDLALLAIQSAPALSPADVAPLERTHSRLLRRIAAVAADAAARKPITAGIVRLIDTGQPLVMNWALAYSAKTKVARRKLAIAKALFAYSSIVDGQRGQDYGRALLAARQLGDQRPAGYARVLTHALLSPRRAIVEAVLAGMMGSGEKPMAKLVRPLWGRLSRMPDDRIRQYAAVILARVGDVNAAHVLAATVLGAGSRNAGFRAFAGWYYAKLTKQTPALLKLALQ